MRAYLACGALLVLIAVPFTEPAQASAVSLTQAALTQQITSPLAGGDIVEKKGSPKWCRKHPKKCAKMGGVPM